MRNLVLAAALAALPGCAAAQHGPPMGGPYEDRPLHPRDRRPAEGESLLQPPRVAFTLQGQTYRCEYIRDAWECDQ